MSLRLVNSWVMELSQKKVSYRFGMPQATQDLTQRSCERYSCTLVWISTMDMIDILWKEWDVIDTLWEGWMRLRS